MDDNNFKKLIQRNFSKGSFISAKNDNFLNSDEKEFKTTLNKAEELNNFPKKHPWLGKNFLQQ